MLQVTVGAALVGLLHPWAGPLIWFGSAFAVLAIVATANGVNFMDGINAISSIHAILWSGTYAWMLHRLGVDAVLPMALALGTSALVFLPWNVGHAKAFLGDAGSYLIGASVGVLAVLSIVNGGGIAGLLPLAVYAADTSTTLARRALRGEPVTTAHSDHTYQRLVPLVGSHAAVAAIVLGFSGACSFLGVLVLSATAAAQVIAVLATLGLVLLYLQLPSVARRCQARYHK
jgi:UDP-N-acetylmuramyl pentapeptide phosphotransferase/UDP-N-acetylglucosamine-1-phosphate transferase